MANFDHIPGKEVPMGHGLTLDDFVHVVFFMKLSARFFEESKTETDKEVWNAATSLASKFMDAIETEEKEIAFKLKTKTKESGEEAFPYDIVRMAREDW